MPKEIFDLESALVNDEIEPLFIYKFGSVDFRIFPSSALSGEDSFLYVKSQLYAAAVATEYEELQKRSQELMDRQKSEGMTREIAEEYSQIMGQLNEKSIELDDWTLKYVASLAKTQPQLFAEKMQTEIDRINREQNRTLTLSKVINILYQKINQELASITVKTQEEEELELYDHPTPPQLEGKAQESEQTIDTENTANGSTSAACSLNPTSEQPVEMF